VAIPSIRSKVIDDIAYSVVDMYLRNHSLSVLDDRLLSNIKGKLDSVNVLRDVWLEQMGGSPEKLIELYEKTNDLNGTQHYENLIDTILLTFVAEFFAALLAGIIVEDSKNRANVVNAIRRLYRKPVNKMIAATNEVTSKYEQPIRYLLQVYALKEYCERQRLPQAEFIRLRECIRKTVYSEKKETLPADFVHFYSVFLENHLLPNLEQNYAQEMGVEFVKLSLETNFDAYIRDIASRVTKNEVDDINAASPLFEKKLEGIATGKRGVAIGKVTIVLTESDCEKVRRGDVVVVDEMCPDYVPAAKLAVALVSNRGGIVSHTAVIGRALNLPTVVGTGKATEVLKNGVEARVDAVHGTVSVSV
jgi:phosphohistidine swiveling domain-containing protein